MCIKVGENRRHEHCSYISSGRPVLHRTEVSMPSCSSSTMYLTLVAVMTSAVAADASIYCSLCRPGSVSGDRAHHTMCLYQASVFGVFGVRPLVTGY